MPRSEADAARDDVRRLEIGDVEAVDHLGWSLEAEDASEPGERRLLRVRLAPAPQELGARILARELEHAGPRAAARHDDFHAAAERSYSRCFAASRIRTSSSRSTSSASPASTRAALSTSCAYSAAPIRPTQGAEHRPSGCLRQGRVRWFKTESGQSRSGTTRCSAARVARARRALA